MADVTYIPDGNNQANSWLPWMMAGNGNFGGLFGGAGGSAFLGALLGSFFPNLFGWNGGGFNGMGGGAAAALGAQATANNNTDLIMQAINGTDADVRALAASNGSDFNAVKSELNTLQSALATIGSQVGMSGLQIINAIQAGNSTLASQLCECCCSMKQLVTSQGYENQIATLNQTNALGGAISTASQRNVDAIADLKTTMVKEFCDAKERDMQTEINRQGEIITQLRNEADNARQTNAIAAMIAPLSKEIDDIKCKLPNTVNVTYPNLYAVNATPYVSGGYYQGGFNGVYGFPGIGGFNGGINF